MTRLSNETFWGKVCRGRNRHRKIKIKTQIYLLTCKHLQAKIQRHKERGRKTDRQVERKVGEETGKKPRKMRAREREREREREIKGGEKGRDLLLGSRRVPAMRVFQLDVLQQHLVAVRHVAAQVALEKGVLVQQLVPAQVA